MMKLPLHNLFRSALVACAACVAFTGADAVSSAHADKCSDANEAAEGGGGKNYKMVKGPDGRKVFVIEKAFVVCGKVPKPQVVYVLQATNINYEWENLKQDFLPKIVNAVSEAPF